MGEGGGCLWGPVHSLLITLAFEPFLIKRTKPRVFKRDSIYETATLIASGESKGCKQTQTLQKSITVLALRILYLLQLILLLFYFIKSNPFTYYRKIIFSQNLSTEYSIFSTHLAPVHNTWHVQEHGPLWIDNRTRCLNI